MQMRRSSVERAASRAAAAVARGGDGGADGLRGAAATEAVHGQQPHHPNRVVSWNIVRRIVGAELVKTPPLDVGSLSGVRSAPNDQRGAVNLVRDESLGASWCLRW